MRGSPLRAMHAPPREPALAPWYAPVTGRTPGAAPTGEHVNFDIRTAYLAWFRRAVPFVVGLPMALTALMQAAASSVWWRDIAPQPGAVRYLFISVAVAGIVIGRTTRDNETRDGRLAPDALRSLSSRLLVHALAPVTIGAVLAVMTRQLWDYWALLAATLIGLALLFPRFDQWVVWSGLGRAGEA